MKDSGSTERLLAGEVVSRAALELEIEGDMQPWCGVAGAAVVDAMVALGWLELVDGNEDGSDQVRRRR